MLLHEPDILKHLLCGAVIAGIGIAVVSVDASELNRHIIDLHNTVYDLYLPEARLLAYDLTLSFYLKRIQSGALGGPEPDIPHT